MRRHVDAVDGIGPSGTIPLTRERRVLARAQVDVEAPPAVVYDWVTAPDRVVTWVKDLMESRPLTDGASLEVGARSVEVLRIGGRLVPVPAEVTALEPGRFVENRLQTPDGTAVSRVLITATSTGSTVTQSMEAVFTGMRLVPTSIVTRLLAQRLNGDLRRLKSLVENT